MKQNTAFGDFVPKGVRELENTLCTVPLYSLVTASLRYGEREGWGWRWEGGGRSGGGGKAEELGGGERGGGVLFSQTPLKEMALAEKMWWPQQ